MWSPQASADPTLPPLFVIWNRSPEFAALFGHDLVTVTVGWAFSVLVIVQLAVCPLISVPEQPVLLFVFV